MTLPKITGNYVVTKNVDNGYTIICSCDLCSAYLSAITAIGLASYKCLPQADRWSINVTYSHILYKHDYPFIFNLSAAIAGCLGNARILHVYLDEWPKKLLGNISHKKISIKGGYFEYYVLALKSHQYLMFMWVLKQHVIEDIVHIIMKYNIMCNDGISSPH
jgi:hypothetical protein